MSRVINLQKFKDRNYRYVAIYFNTKQENYWVNNYPRNPRFVTPPSKGWKLLYTGLMSKDEIEAVEQGKPLSKEYGMYK